MQKTTQILTMNVDNEFGVLTRITALIRRAGLNIKGLSVAETVSPQIARLTVNVEMQGIPLEDILGRLQRLDCVRGIQAADDGHFYKRELIAVTCARSSHLWQGKQILWQTKERVCFESIQTPEEIGQMLSAANQDEIFQIYRSGVVTVDKEGN